MLRIAIGSNIFTYDPAGNLITASNANIGYTLTRDANNRLTGITDNSGRGTPKGTFYNPSVNSK
jgi:YD repeat-containing protein